MVGRGRRPGSGDTRAEHRRGGPGGLRRRRLRRREHQVDRAAGQSRPGPRPPLLRGQGGPLRGDDGPARRPEGRRRRGGDRPLQRGTCSSNASSPNGNVKEGPARRTSPGSLRPWPPLPRWPTTSVSSSSNGSDSTACRATPRRPSLRRRSLVSSQLLGLAWTRYVMRLEPMASATRSEVARWAGPTIDRYVTCTFD